MKATLDGVFGVKFPVRDLTASRAWYERLFELSPLFEFPDEDGVVRGVVYAAAGLGGTGFALRERADVAGLSGFDPVNFGVRDKAAIDAWVEHLTKLGIEYRLVLATIGWLVIFHDPDGLEIHLYSRETHGQDMSNESGRGRSVGAAMSGDGGES